MEEGVRLSLEAETVLGTIIGKTEGSLHNAMKVARAAEEQTSGLKLVTEAIQQIQFMITRINAAVSEQKKASHEILGASEGVHGYAREIRGTITSQADEALSIAEMLQEIHSRLTTIADSTTEQQKASAEIVYALETVNVKAEESIKLATSLDAIVEDLHTQADLLSAKVGKFTV